jgi:hypothetical protein
MRKVLLAALLTVFALATSAWAQAPVPVQNVPTELRASNVCLDSSGTGALTIPAQAGASFYMNSLEINAFAQAGAAPNLGTPGEVTSSGLVGSPTFGRIQASAQAAGTVIANYFYQFSGNALKGATSTAIVLTPATISNVNYHLSACGYYAP